MNYDISILDCKKHTLVYNNNLDFWFHLRFYNGVDCAFNW